MKINQNTMNILSNFAKINPNILISKGNVLKTINESKSISASAKVEESFPIKFGIYDLNEFLSALSLLRDCDISFDEKFLTLSEGNTSIKYYFSNEELLTYPTRNINMPEIDVSFTLSNLVLSNLKKAAATFGHDNLIIEGNNGTISLNVSDINDRTANSYSINVDSNNDCKENFRLIVNINNLKFLPFDYEVNLSRKLIAHFTNNSKSIDYWVALEGDSTFGEQ